MPPDELCGVAMDRQTLVASLKAFTGKVAASGSLALPAEARVAPSRQAIVYVENVAASAEALGLTAVETGANVLLLESEDGMVFDGMTKRDGLPCAALSQVVVDLLVAPGRGPSEAEALLNWMIAHEDSWRRA